MKKRHNMFRFRKPSDFPPVYRGLLTTAQAADGMRLALNNAKALVSDAECLLASERWARAAALAVLAVEEEGKLSLLRYLIIAQSEAQRRRYWEAFRTHSEKCLNLAVLDSSLGRGRDLFQALARNVAPHQDDPVKQFEILFEHYLSGGAADEFAQLVDQSEWPHRVDALKMTALYVDIRGDGIWTTPEQSIDEGTARAIVARAKYLVQPAIEELSLTSREELELWVKHVTPLGDISALVPSRMSKADLERCTRAFLSVYEEAAARGILRHGRRRSA